MAETKMVKYKVIAPCYIQDVYRTPDRHNTVYLPADAKVNKNCLVKASAHVDVVDDDDADAPIKASKSASELAADNEVDLQDVVGTGKEGAITKGDVEKFIKAREGGEPV